MTVIYGLKLHDFTDPLRSLLDVSTDSIRHYAPLQLFVHIRDAPAMPIQHKAAECVFCK